MPVLSPVEIFFFFLSPCFDPHWSKDRESVALTVPMKHKRFSGSEAFFLLQGSHVSLTTLNVCGTWWIHLQGKKKFHKDFPFHSELVLFFDWQWIEYMGGRKDFIAAKFLLCKSWTFKLRTTTYTIMDFTVKLFSDYIKRNESIWIIFSSWCFYWETDVTIAGTAS